MKSVFSFIAFIIFFAISCTKKNTTPVITPPQDTTHTPTDTTKNPVDTTTSFFAKGADISWITEMENNGIVFFNKNGSSEDLFQILKEEGINSIRIRAWVNPANNYNNTADVIAKAIRAKNAGMKIMIDFHYSDTWADPAHQVKPLAWNSGDINVLKDSLYNYTVSVMNALKQKNVFPEWVQVGNETNDGMLWPEGQASVSMNNFALLVNAGYDAVKSVYDSSKVIVHISNGYDNNLFRWIFDGLKNNNAKWDVIGLSLYPPSGLWNSYNIQCQANMSDMIIRYNKPVMICEVGMSWTDSINCNLFIKDIISKTKTVANNKGLGVFYWEPEAYANWQGYTLGAFNNSGMPTIALDAFQ